MSFLQMRALITGVNSYVNRALLFKLVELGYEVTAQYHSDNELTKDLKAKLADVRFVQADFSEKDSFLNFIQESMDEKLQTCDFKKKQYQKLFSSMNYEVEYVYILSDWFRKKEYMDVRDYIISVGCRFYFEYLPLHELGLPVPVK